MARSKEVFWWSLFSAGGVIAALFIPVLVVVSGIILPYFTGGSEAGYQKIHSGVSFWLVRLILFGIIFLSFFHCAHRIRHVLMDLGLRSAGLAIAVLCYLGATAGTVVAACILIGL